MIHQTSDRRILAVMKNLKVHNFSLHGSEEIWGFELTQILLQLVHKQSYSEGIAIQTSYPVQYTQRQCTSHTHTQH